MAVILLVEDDAGIRSALSRALTERGHAVTWQPAGLPGLQSVIDDRPDVVLLDLGLPDVDGLQVLSMLRSVSEVAVIVITARDDDAEVVKALDAGADDFVVKPFGADHLDARIRAVLRRSGAQRSDGPITVGGLVVDPRTRSANLDGRSLELSRKEFDLLLALAQRAGEVVSKRDLLAEVWRQPYGGGDQHRRRAPVLAAPQARRDRRRSALPAQLARGRDPVGRTRDRLRAGAMRRRLSFLVATTTSAVVLAFLIPFAFLVRNLAEDRAITGAKIAAESLGSIALKIADRGQLTRYVSTQVGARPTGTTSLVLPDRTTIGPPVPSSDPYLAAALQGSSSTRMLAHEAILYVSVIGPSGTVVVRTVVPDSQLHQGVMGATATLGVLGLMLLLAAMVAADRIARRAIGPIRDVAAAADALRAGRLHTRVPERGPPEVVAMAGALNRLAGRIEQLLAAERDSVADLSHRLRTPVTALRLDSESIADAETAERIREHVEQLERTVDAIVHDARRPTTAAWPPGATPAGWSASGCRSGRRWPMTRGGCCGWPCPTGRCTPGWRPPTSPTCSTCSSTTPSPTPTKGCRSRSGWFAAPTA